VGTVPKDRSGKTREIIVLPKNPLPESGRLLNFGSKNNGELRSSFQSLPFIGWLEYCSEKL
jgi:hypothetical protein